MDSVLLGATPAQPAHFLSDEKGEGATVPEMPSHWQLDKGQGNGSWRRPVYLVHRFLCLVAFGSGGLQRIWESSYPGCPAKAWKDEMEIQQKRFEHINLLVRPQSIDRHFAGFDYNVWSR